MFMDPSPVPSEPALESLRCSGAGRTVLFVRRSVQAAAFLTVLGLLAAGLGASGQLHAGHASTLKAQLAGSDERCVHARPHCGQLLIRAGLEDQPFAAPMRAFIVGPASPTVRALLTTSEDETAAVVHAGSYRLRIRIQPCRMNCRPNNVRPPIDCQGRLRLPPAGIITATVGFSLTACWIRLTPGRGPTITVVPDRSIAAIRLGESSTQVVNAYGRGRQSIHPATRTYAISGQQVVAQFDHHQHVNGITAQGPGLEIAGQRLTKGFAYWRDRLRPYGWSFSRCQGIGGAVSALTRTSIAFFTPHWDQAGLIGPRLAAGYSTGCAAG